MATELTVLIPAVNTDDDIYLDENDNSVYDVALNFTQTRSNTVTVDFGDGSEPVSSVTTGQCSLTHTYSVGDEPVEYTIRIQKDRYNRYLLGNEINEDSNNPITAVMPSKILTAINLSWDVATTNNYAFANSNISDINLTPYISELAVGVFKHCLGITAAVIPNGVLRIGAEAFWNCHNITGSITIPNSVVELGDNAFRECEKITAVTLGTGLTKINKQVFYADLALADITFPENITVIDDNAFQTCTALTTVDIPASVTRLGTSVFANCRNLNKVYLRNKNLVTDKLIFQSCSKLTSAGPIGGNYHIEFAWDVEIPDHAFECGRGAGYLRQITLPQTLKRIGSYAFENCALTSINIPGTIWDAQSSVIYTGVEYIGERAFYWNRALTYIEIPTSVKAVGPNAFSDCELEVIVNHMRSNEILLVNEENKTQAIFSVSPQNQRQNVSVVVPEVVECPPGHEEGGGTFITYGTHWNYYTTIEVDGQPQDVFLTYTTMSD